jgi:hypothetical protein
MSPPVQWTSPVSVWPALAENGSQAGFNQPVILRFDTDYYTEELLSILQHAPGRLIEWQARPETWRSPAQTPEPVKPLPQFAQTLLRARLADINTATQQQIAEDEEDEEAPTNLKLYQPAHMRHYMVAADLICRVPGLPHRSFDTPQGERASFVLRRLLPKDGATVDAGFVFNTQSCDEYAYVVTPRGEQWRKAESDRLEDNEERLPMFPMAYQEADGQKRRILAGVIPLGKRETYINSAQAAADDTADGSADVAQSVQDRRVLLLQMQVTEPWRRLRETKNKTRQEISLDGVDEEDKPSSDRLEQARGRLRNLAQMQSWYILLDLKEFLEKYVQDVWQAIEDNAPADSSLQGQALELYDLLATNSIDDALRNLISGDNIQRLERAVQNYEEGVNDDDYPDFTFLLVDVDTDTSTPSASNALEALIIRPDSYNPGDSATFPPLEQTILKALPATMPPRTPPIPAAMKEATARRPQGPGWFIIRCVFERPNCVPYQPELLSQPTAAFQMASYYDSDAPARPVRIPMPEDTSLNGLRKHSKGTAFVLSDMLCGQVERVRSFSFGDLVLSVLPWPFRKSLGGSEARPCGSDAGASFGMILSLSIPIITIAGLLLLIIIVKLLDIIFRWLPYFITLIPIINVNTNEEGS